jgi:hypothetical protein
MTGFFRKYFNKLYYQKWIIGISKENLTDIIRNRKFDPDIHWLFRKSYNKIYGDPFFIRSKDGKIEIVMEVLQFEGDYGRLALLTLDEEFRIDKLKILLDTKSHLSYPFVFKEDGRYFIFPESSKNGRLSCYEYDPVTERLAFLQDILEYPLLDSTIIKKNGTYWIFGVIADDNAVYQEHVFYSDNLLGPYVNHPANPVKRGLDGTRSAGSFIEVDGTIYRPAQNCQKEYGDSITIYEITELNENRVAEEPYMNIEINRRNHHNNGIFKVHTINYINDLIVVDGKNWSFSPFRQLANYLQKKILLTKKYLRSTVKPEDNLEE